MKLVRDGDIRRCQCGGDPMCTSLEQLRVVAGHLFGFVEHEIAALTFMYMDEEGDLCTLCDATLPDALSRVSGSVSLRLFISSGLGHIQNACTYFQPLTDMTLWTEKKQYVDNYRAETSRPAPTSERKAEVLQQRCPLCLPQGR